MRDSNPATVALFDLTQAVAAARRLKEIYGAALDCLEKCLHVEKSSILLFDEAGVMRFRAWRGLSAGYREAVEGHSPWGPDERNPEPVLVGDVRDDAGLAPLRATIEAEDICALAFVPLVASGRLLGKFMLYYSGPHAFNDEEVLQARTIASQVAFAIEHHRARRQRQHLAAMFGSSAAGIAEFDAEGRFIEVNDRFCELVGRTADELLGDTQWLDTIHPDDRPHAAAQLAALVAEDRDFTLEQRYLRPDGSVAWVSGTVSSLRNDDDAQRGGLALVTEISARKAAEERLRKSEARYRSLIEGLDLAVYTTDAAGRITLYNEAAAALWGRSPRLDHDLWCGSWRLYRPDGSPMPHDECPMAVTLKSQVPVRGVEIIAEQPGGGRRWLLPYPTPLLDGDGTLMGAVNVLVDITELKLAQGALEQALVAKDDFLGMISHELRNPVLQVAGNARLLRDGWSRLPDDTRASMVEDLHSASSRIQRLVENMLVLSRFERGMLPDAEPHLLQRILKDTLDEFRRRFPQTVLHVDIPPDLPPILTSPNTVDQVCWNLLTNAQKHGPPEGPVEVIAAAIEGNVEVEVRDRGPGVPEDELDSLFEPYFRASNTQVHAGGLGLGLSVCRRLVEAHGGEMWARRRVPHGMEFGLRFQVAEAVTVE